MLLHSKKLVTALAASNEPLPVKVATTQPTTDFAI